MPTVSNPEHPNGEWYEELCALAAIGELSPAECEELQCHLAECPGCRQLYAEFRRISAHDLGMVAVEKWAAPGDGDFGGALNEQELFARLRERTSAEQAPVGAGHASCRSPWAGSWYRNGMRRAALWLCRPAVCEGALAILLCAFAAAGAYHLREAQLSPALTGLQSQASAWKLRAEASQTEVASATQQLRQDQTEREALRGLLREAQSKVSEMQAQQDALERDLAAVHVEADQKGREVESLRAGAEERRKQLADLQARLQFAMQSTEDQRQIAESLRSKLESVEQAARNAPETRSINDLEARSLFGARDLHIVDVYDVNGSGKTKRTYGRVFYAEKKLLIFYAFDLGDKRRDRAPAGFQAWGYRQPNESRPENLGLFTVDDASMNRWVLEVNNPRVLEHIDAVFVTLESPGGSRSPRGRRLLYANLAAPANHP